jgi:anti-sigma B factor antagonist
MKLDVVNEANGITKLLLSGSMDIEGTLAIDAQISEISKAKEKVIVDLSNVDFLASLGIRTLVMSAKSISTKGGNMVLLNPQAGVEKVLKSSGIDTVIPIAPDLNAAIALLR